MNHSRYPTEALARTPPRLTDAGLLPTDRSYRGLIAAFFVPYALYVGLGAALDGHLSFEWIQAIKGLATLSALLYFRRSYRLGKWNTKAAGIALLVTPALFLIWALPLWLLSDIQSLPVTVSLEFTIGSVLRAANSVLLVPIFEELLCRVYIQRFFHHEGPGLGPGIDRFDEHPRPLQHPPLSWQAVAAATLLFTIGHPPVAFPSAVLYFLATTWLYARTRSLWACIVAHAAVNLLIAMAVISLQWRWLW